MMEGFGGDYTGANCRRCTQRQTEQSAVAVCYPPKSKRFFMAYVPGFQHDVFVSYAHGDDREWISRFVLLLNSVLDRRLGTRTSVWLDEDDNRKTRDFSKEIPDSVRASAVFLLLPSPTFIRSAYCVDQECRIFAESIDERRGRFAVEGFKNDLFAVRCPILPVDRNEHWTLFPGLTDIPFHDESATFDFESAEFEKSFGQLVGELVDLLKRMRNHSTSVFVYPPHPGPDVQDAHKQLVAELSAHSYRVLPDRKVNLTDQLREASLSVFLIGENYDEHAGGLVEIAAQLDKPWVAWCSPGVENAGADQIGFSANVEQLESRTKMYLNPGVSPSKLKEEVMALLKPAPRGIPATEGKPSVYLVYNARDVAERKNAGLISYNFRRDFHFEHPDDPAQHTQRLTQSEAVLLVWGNADEDWCSREFLEIVQTARQGDSRGLCVFDPKDTKLAAVEEIRRTFGQDVYIGEQFGRFDPSRLEVFFTPLRRRPDGAQS